LASFSPIDRNHALALFCQSIPRWELAQAKRPNHELPGEESNFVSLSSAFIAAEAQDGPEHYPGFLSAATLGRRLSPVLRVL